MQDNNYSPMQLLKRSLYAMRNGVVADALRKGGSPYKMIFGVILPQLTEIAQQCGKNKSLAIEAWADSSTRESMLIAPMLMPVEDFSIDEARHWISTAKSTEAADILCLKLLRQLPYALQLAEEMLQCDDELQHYAGLRLMCNLAPRFPQRAVEIGELEAAKQNPATRQLANILLSYKEI